MPKLNQQQANDLVAYVLSELDSGTSRQQIINTLYDSGLDYKEAVTFVDDVGRMWKNSDKERGTTRIVRGVTIILIGVGLNVFVWVASGSYGLSLISIGALCWGLYDIVRGLIAKRA